MFKKKKVPKMTGVSFMPFLDSPMCCPLGKVRWALAACFQVVLGNTRPSHCFFLFKTSRFFLPILFLELIHERQDQCLRGFSEENQLGHSKELHFPLRYLKWQRNHRAVFFLNTTCLFSWDFVASPHFRSQGCSSSIHLSIRGCYLLRPGSVLDAVNGSVYM